MTGSISTRIGFSALADLTDQISPYASYSESLSAPRTDSLYAVTRFADGSIGNPTVQPETSKNIDLGYRMSDYDNSGNEDTYKIGFSADMGMVRARGGYNRAIRAPGINELFSIQSIALWAGSDPCAGPTPTFTVAQCENTGLDASRYGLVVDNPAGQYNQLGGGNPKAPDTAKSVRGMALQFKLPGGQLHQMAMLNTPMASFRRNTGAAMAASAAGVSETPRAS